MYDGRAFTRLCPDEHRLACGMDFGGKTGLGLKFLSPVK